MNEVLNIAVACGGTGGHVMPGLATAHVLRARGHAVTLWLTGKEVENQSVASWNGHVVRVPARGFPTSVSFEGLVAAWRLRQSARRSARYMRANKPDVLLAMGSYASAGPVLAARRLRIPYVLHEANVLPGRAISFLSRKATFVACHFDETRYYLPGRPVRITGMPLRADLDPHVQTELSDLPPGGLFTILIMGGSNGAHVINERATEAILKVVRCGHRIRVIHLTGAQDQDWVREYYARAEIPAWVRPFATHIAPIYQTADMAVCRAGASTCAELCLFGVPSLLVPYPYAANDHQMANARSLEKAGGAHVVAEQDLTVAWLADYMGEAIRTPSRLAKMSAALKEHMPENGARRLADLVEEASQIKRGQRVGVANDA